MNRISIVLLALRRAKRLVIEHTHLRGDVAETERLLTSARWTSRRLVFERSEDCNGSRPDCHAPG